MKSALGSAGMTKIIGNARLFSLAQLRVGERVSAVGVQAGVRRANA